MKNTRGEREGGRQPPSRGRGFKPPRAEPEDAKEGERSTWRKPTKKVFKWRAIGGGGRGANRGPLHHGETPCRRTRKLKAVADKK